MTSTGRKMASRSFDRASINVSTPLLRSIRPKNTMGPWRALMPRVTSEKIGSTPLGTTCVSCASTVRLGRATRGSRWRSCTGRRHGERDAPWSGTWATGAIAPSTPRIGRVARRHDDVETSAAGSKPGKQGALFTLAVDDVDRFVGRESRRRSRRPSMRLKTRNGAVRLLRSAQNAAQRMSYGRPAGAATRSQGASCIPR